MKDSWKEVKLSEILKLNVDSVDVLSQPEFHFAGVYCFGNGLFEKGYLSGAETTYKTYNRLHKNHIAISKVKGWEGAIALVTNEFEGMFLSPVYPTFNLISEDIADIKYIDLFLKQKHVWQKLLENSKGIGARRNSVSEKQFLNLSIPLPPLPEQQRIVSKIEGVKTKLDRIKVLRAEQEKEINNLLFSKYTEVVKDAKWLPMKEVAPIFRRKVELNPDETYFEIGVRSFGRGLFEKPSFKGAELTWQQPYWVKEGDLLFSNIKAWEGAVGLIPKQYDGWVGSHRYLTCLPNLEVIDPEFLYYYFRTYEGVEKLNSASPGTADRNRTLNTTLLSLMQIPVPSLELQKEFVALLEKVNTIKQHHTQTNHELTELMPSLLDKAFKGDL